MRKLIKLAVTTLFVLGALVAGPVAANAQSPNDPLTVSAGFAQAQDDPVKDVEKLVKDGEHLLCKLTGLFCGN